MKALLFDMDGTLADTEPVHLEALRRMLRHHGVDPDIPDFHDRMAGLTTEAVTALLFPGVDAQGVRDRVAMKEAHFRDLGVAIQPTPGLMALLDQAETAGVKTGLVTNGPRINIDFLLDVLGLTGRFDTIVSALDLPRAKPDPLPYLTALTNLSVNADDAVAFEDSLPGVRSATAAGLRCVGITTSQPEDALRAAGASTVMADFTAFSIVTV